MSTTRVGIDLDDSHTFRAVGDGQPARVLACRAALGDDAGTRTTTQLTVAHTVTAGASGMDYLVALTFRHIGDAATQSRMQ